MLALQINSLKSFMNQLLTTDSFDIFLLEEATISTFCTYTIDGHINRDFYSEEELAAGNAPYEFQPWSETKSLCFDLIKGKHTPLFFKFVLLLKPEYILSILKKEAPDFDASQVKSFVLTVKYDGEKAILTTGTAYHTFILSKEPDILWDKTLTKYLSSKGIEFETL